MPAATLGPHLFRHGQEAVQSGDGDGQVGVVVAALVAVKHQSVDFFTEELHQVVGSRRGDGRGVEVVGRGPCGLWFLVVVIEEDAGLRAVDDALQRAEHDAFLAAEFSGAHV